MPVNFQQLAPIEAPKVIGTQPMQPQQPSALGRLGSGLTDAVQNYQKSELMGKQGALLDVQTKREGVGLEEDLNKQEKRRTHDQIVKEADGNWDNYVKANMHVDPVGTMDAMNKKALLDKTIADSRHSNANGAAQELKNANEYWADIGGVAGKANELKDANGNPQPLEVKKAFFETAMVGYPKEMQEMVTKVAPDGFTEGTGVVLADAGARAQARLIKANEKEATPSATKKLQDEIAAEQDPARKAQLETKLNNELKPAQPMIEDPATKVRTQTTAKYLEQRDTVKTVAVNNKASLSLMANLTDQALSGSFAELDLGLRKAINAVTGTPLDASVPASEALNSLFKTYQINQQALMKGSSSDSDMGLLKDTGPQLTNTAEGRKLMINHLGYREDMTANQVDFEHAWSDAHGAKMTGATEAWNKFVQTRHDFDPKTGMFKSTPTEKDWKAYVDENYQPPVTKAIGGVEYVQKDGKWYTK